MWNTQCSFFHNVVLPVPVWGILWLGWEGVMNGFITSLCLSSYESPYGVLKCNFGHLGN